MILVVSAQSGSPVLLFSHHMSILATILEHCLYKLTLDAIYHDEYASTAISHNVGTSIAIQ